MSDLRHGYDSEHEQDLAPGTDGRHVDRDAEVPGKSTRTDGLEAAGLVQRASSGSGSRLPDLLRRKFEGSLGVDLGGVRVHTGAESAQAARAVGARAYTVGQDVHFGANQFDPASGEGERLLAHEVAHTAQQSAGGAAGGGKVAAARDPDAEGAADQEEIEVSDPGDAHEVEADQAADAMVGGEAAPVTPAAGLARMVLQREPENAAPKPSPKDFGLTGVVKDDEINWDAEAQPTPGDLPGTEPWTSTPKIIGQGSTRWKAAGDTFRNDFEMTKASWNELGELAAQIKAKEAQLGWIDDLDPDRTSAKTERHRTGVGDTFSGDEATARDINQDKVGPTERGKLQAAKLATQQAEDGVKDAQNRVKDAALDVKSALTSAGNAFRECDIQDEVIKQAQLNFNKEKVSQDKNFALGQVGIATTAVTGILGAAGSALTAGPKAGFAAGAGAVAGTAMKSIETVVARDYDLDIRKILKSIQVSQERVAALTKINKLGEAHNFLNAALKGANALDTANRAVKTAMDARKVAYSAHGELANTTARGAGANKADAKKLGATIESVAPIEDILGHIQGMHARLQLPTYSKQSGVGAGLCDIDSREEFITKLGKLRGAKETLAQHAERWNKRLASAKAKAANN